MVGLAGDMASFYSLDVDPAFEKIRAGISGESEPYVLIAAALAALTVGLITYANTVDSVHNSIKNVNNEVKELKKNTEDSIASTEEEITVFRDKASQYENLREKANRTAGEEERLAQLAEELRQYMPEGTQLINEQTGAYNSLAESVDSVSEAMRRKAKIAAYEDEYTELIKQQLEAQKNLDEANQKLINTPTDNTLKALFAAKNYDDALKAVEDIETRLSEPDVEINKLYDSTEKSPVTASAGFYDEGSALSTTGKYYAEQGRLAFEAAEKEKSAQEKLSKEQREAEEKRISDSAAALKDRLEADKNYTAEMYYSDLEALTAALDEESELYKKFNGEIVKGRRKLAGDEEKKLLDEQNKIVEDGLSDILKTYENAFDELDKKRENYSKKLMSVGGDLFSVNEIENPDGSKVTEYAVNNIDEQLRKMREYHSAVAKLKKAGASDGLLSELAAVAAPSADYGKEAADSYIDAFKTEEGCL
ncbi:MAG: hypothetical protein NC395_11425 [Prevotella sp.]|nr:hypothetical protein [Prevotella sp.]